MILDPIEAMNSRSELNPSASHNQQSSRQAYTPAPDKLDTRYKQTQSESSLLHVCLSQIGTNIFTFVNRNIFSIGLFKQY